MNKEETENRFIAIVNEHEAIIYKVCYLYSNGEVEINDLYQEIVICLWKAFPSYRGDSKVSTWIYSVALNTAISFMRRSKSRPSYVPLLVDRDEVAKNDTELQSQLKEMSIICLCGKPLFQLN